MVRLYALVAIKKIREGKYMKESSKRTVKEIVKEIPWYILGLTFAFGLFTGWLLGFPSGFIVGITAGTQ